MAMVGNPLINGVLTARALASVSLPEGSSDPSSTTVGTVSARISGGCTIGPKRPRRRTAQIAPTAPTK